MTFVGNRFKKEAREKVINFMQLVVAKFGHPLPFHVRKSNGTIVDAGDVNEAVIVLPPCFTKRGLYRRYLKQEEPVIISWRTFYVILETNVSYVRVSVRQRGLCDFCFTMRHKGRMLKDKNVDLHMRILHLHLDMAEKGKVYYKHSRVFGQELMHEEQQVEPTIRLQYGYLYILLYFFYAFVLVTQPQWQQYTVLNFQSKQQQWCLLITLQR